MKLIRLATVAVLTSTIFAGGAQAFAVERHADLTENKVEFEAGSGEVDIVPPVPYPPVEIVDPNPASGPFTISHVPKTFDFGSQGISTMKESYSMVAELEDAAADSEYEGKIPYVSFAQVIDSRGLPNSEWELAVSLSDFTNDDSHTLRGAQLELIAPTISHNDNYDDELFPTAHTNHISEDGDRSLILDTNDAALPVMSASNGRGQGRSSVYWGDARLMIQQYEDEDHTEPILNDAIKLHIPATTVPEATSYQAVLTWTLSATVSENGENNDVEAN